MKINSIILIPFLPIIVIVLVIGARALLRDINKTYKLWSILLLLWGSSAAAQSDTLHSINHIITAGADSVSSAPVTIVISEQYFEVQTAKECGTQNILRAKITEVSGIGEEKKYHLLCGSYILPVYDVYGELYALHHNKKGKSIYYTKHQLLITNK